MTDDEGLDLERVHRAHVWFAEYGILLVLLTGAGAIALTVFTRLLAPVIPAVATGVLVVGVRELTWWFGRQRTPCSLRATATGVELSPGGSIDAAHVLRVKTYPRRQLVHVWTKGAVMPMEFIVANSDQCAQAERILGFGFARRTLQLSAGAPLRGGIQRTLRIVGCLGAAGILLRGLVSDSVLQVAVALLILVPLTFALFWGRELTIGADGYSLSWFGMRRFVPYAEIQRIDEFFTQAYRGTRGGRGAAGARVTLKNGRTDTIVLGERLDADDVIRGVARLHEAMSAWERGTSGAAPLLEPAGRSVDEWLAELARLTRPAAAYREISLGRDELFKVLEDAASSALARVGAAIALARGTTSEEDRARLRSVADASARPAFRLVVERALDPGDEGLTEAIAELEAEEAALAVASARAPRA